MRILVVEDEVDLAHTLHTGLTAEGYSVDLARLAEAHLSLGDIDAAVATAHDAVARM